MRAAIGAMLLGMLMMFVATGQPTGADFKTGSRADDRAADVRGQRQKGEATRTEWFADPQRGWIRAEQRPQKQREQPRDKRPDAKGERRFWEY